MPVSIRRTPALAASLALLTLLAACGGSPTTSTAAVASTGAVASTVDDAEQVVRDLVDAINAGDAEAAMGLIAPDADLFGETVSSPEDAVGAFACAADVTSVESDDDAIVVELSFTGPAPLATADDCPVGSEVRQRITVENGQVVEISEAP